MKKGEKKKEKMASTNGSVSWGGKVTKRGENKGGGGGGRGRGQGRNAQYLSFTPDYEVHLTPAD